MTTGKFLSAAILCLAVGSAMGDDVLEGNYNVTAFCTAVKTGTNLGSIVSCDYYYVCTSNGPVKSSCPSGYAFSLSAGNCAPVDQANCYYGLENPCLGKTGENWVPVTGTCNQYYYCKDGLNMGQGSCKGTQNFDKTSQQCIYGSTPCNPAAVDNSDEPNLTNICDVVPPGKYFGDTQYCKTWNYCQADGTLQSNSCADAFNVETGECGFNTGDVCSRVTDNSLGTASTTCKVNGELTGNPTVCGSYYKCNGKSKVSFDCSYGYYFDVVLGSCQPRKTATPIEGCNRCQFATTTWVNAVNTTSCGTYYYCNNGKAVLQSCKEDYYFNESQQGCIADTDPIRPLETYAAANGACTGASVSEDTSSSTSTTTDTTTTTTTTTTLAPADDDDDKTNDDDTNADGSG